MYPIIKEKIRELIKEPVILLILGIEIAVLLSLIFFVHIKIDDNIITNIKIFGINIDEVGLFINMILPNFVDILYALILFLSIIVFSSTTTQILKNPLSKIILTKSISRTNFIFGNYAGTNLFNIINLLIFLFLIIILLFFKTGSLIVAEPLILSYDFVIVIFSLTAIITLLSILVDNEAFVAVISLFLCFYLGGVVGNRGDAYNIWNLILSYTLPPLYYLRGFNSMLNENLINFKTIGLTVLYAAIYLSLSAFIYNKKDLN
jgi:ABC-type transport system involved in multi-copper enzyme maturation permease subunit